MTARVSVDIGGTFTDLVLVSDGRVSAVTKVLTTPDDPSRAIEEGLRRLLKARDPGAVSELVHATTLVSNALIERRLAPTGLVTTAGFRDVLSIGREQRYDLYDLFIEMPQPLVPRRLRWEVKERVLADGTIRTQLERAEVVRIAKRVRTAGLKSVAVCLLHSYRNPAHEHLVREVFEEVAPEVAIALSSDVVPEMGEFVRCCTTAANAAVLPVVEQYMDRLLGRLAGLGLKAPVHIMVSTGGLVPLSTARRFPIRLCESGPAAGALSAVFFGCRDEPNDVLAFDMGGTTAKACLIEAGVPLLARSQEVARVYRFAKGSGLPIGIPTVDLIEIGAGGGSIARRGPMGLLKVGPESSSSLPGPVSYGRGGTEPTVTDADLALGYLDPGFFLGGEMKLDLEAALASLVRLGESLGLSALETAAGIHRIVNENMAGAARVHSIERGRDVRRFALVATGGAGPVHAWGVARALGLRRIVFPANAGVASALGMLIAAPSFEYARSHPSLLSEVDWKEVHDLVEAMDVEGRSELAQTGVEDSQLQTAIAVDLRYRGQGEPITVDLGGWSELGPEQVEEAFRATYRRLFGRNLEGVLTEVMTWRVRVLGPSRALADHLPEAGAPEPLKGTRRIWSPENGEFVEAPVLDRYLLRPGYTIEGPAIVEERESTAVMGAGARGTVDGHGNLWVEIDA
ncbi:MAG: hydantoinase/oxoprolinase family protein [Candidatus Acidiferrales bacterium]